ncbi:MAG: riboflavin synthase [Dehalococcoidia bacterium]|nr:riboflavin synthase [Dehalococcoidia bacterium]
MFTGIVESVGTVRDAPPNALVIDAPDLPGLVLGESVNVNGACLTVARLDGSGFAVDLADETLARTNLGALAPGAAVNLERALTPTSRMGGHFVQGHVDGVGEVLRFDGPESNRTLAVAAPPAIARYIVEKGFVALDGVSLTIARLDGQTFEIAVVPYTYDHTVLGRRRPGDLVNIEADILAKYAERFLAPHRGVE